MKKVEKEEIKNLPAKYKPLGAWAYFGYSILFMIPIVGFICLIVFACSSSNVVRRSYARSYFCGFLIVGLLIFIVLAIFGFNFAAILEFLKSFISQVPGEM